MSLGVSLSLKGAEFRYPNSAKNTLCGVDLEIRPGEWVAVLGSNGSGKSTLMKLLNALLIPTQGFCFVDGEDSSKHDASERIKSKVAMVFQNPEDQIVASVVEEDTAFGPENMGLPSEEILNRVHNALDTVGLWHKHKMPVSALSGGEKQRLALAGAIAVEPACILLDEAMSMLDPAARAEFTSIIKKANTEGMTVVQVTHRLDEIYNANRVIILEAGIISWEGTLPMFLAKPEKTLNQMNFEKPSLSVLIEELSAKGVLNCPPDTDAEKLADIICQLK